METIIAAAITAAVTLAVCLITNHAQAEKTRALIDYRVSELEKKQDKHNNLIERTYRLEGQMSEVQHEVADLKKFHQP
jgi:peptidoglycan hydrolase CwlO-like protein